MDNHKVEDSVRQLLSRLTLVHSELQKILNGKSDDALHQMRHVIGEAQNLVDALEGDEEYMRDYTEEFRISLEKLRRAIHTYVHGEESDLGKLN